MVHRDFQFSVGYFRVWDELSVAVLQRNWECIKREWMMLKHLDLPESQHSGFSNIWKAFHFWQCEQKIAEGSTVDLGILHVCIVQHLQDGPCGIGCNVL